MLKGAASIGIDYGMKSPAITIFLTDKPTDTFSIEKCHMFGFCGKEKFFSNRGVKKDSCDPVKIQIKSGPHLSVSRYPEWEFPMDRFNKLSDWVLRALNLTSRTKICLVGIEGYSYGSHGQVFEIGENTGIMKHSIYGYGYKYITPSPPSIKKFGSGSGKAKKEEMEAAFLAETGLDLNPYLDTVGLKNNSPVSDLIDSYYICKYTWQEMVNSIKT